MLVDQGITAASDTKTSIRAMIYNGDVAGSIELLVVRNA